MMALPTLFLLTAADLLLTFWGLNLGVIQEGNPLMAALFNINPVLSMAVPIVYVGAACLFIYRVRRRVPWLPAVLAILLAIKLGVICLHLGWLVPEMASGVTVRGLNY